MWFEIALLIPTAVLLIPCTVLVVECLAARRTSGTLTSIAGTPHPRIAILIPAHDEAAQIGATVEALVAEVGAGDRIVVIADNCSDATAAVVNTIASSPRAASIVAIERQDPLNVGKGFAISFGIEHLTADPPEIVVLVDADCRVSAGAVAALAAEAARTGTPVQGEYVFAVPADAGLLTTVSAFAALVRNRVRPRGLKALGLPCLLTGSGMAFPWRVLREAPETRGNLVEDMVLGLELSLQGHAPRLCTAAQISSELPVGQQAALRQRRRWEHGHLHTLKTFAPRLLAAGIARRDVGLVGLAADLSVPPLALLVALQLATLATTSIFWATGVSSAAPPTVAAAGLAATTVAVGVAWWRFARAVIPLRVFLAIPLYLVWKLPLYALMIVKGRHRTWERTARPGEEAPPPEPPPSQSV
jgi:cellulose synthase/poly-beta-1,6-N-acetylglucosamine synthase-like glycosyltransferase